jgi:hypothetical protein
MGGRAIGETMDMNMDVGLPKNTLTWEANYL